MSEPVIALDRLSKFYGDVRAVEDLSSSIDSGEIFGFLGANGAGKTTTMRMLCGLTHATSGEATIDGADVWKERHVARTKFGYVAQRFSLYPDLTVEENMRFFGGACRVSRSDLDQRIGNLLQLTDLEAKRETPAGSLSGGMRQLLALGCALVHNPPLLFLDEPTSGLDPVHRQQMWNLLYDLSNDGITIFVTTHYMDEAERCQRLAFLSRGHLIAVGTVAEVTAQFAQPTIEDVFIELQRRDEGAVV
jgi:drug efflux transport system ATP-binding protein